MWCCDSLFSRYLWSNEKNQCLKSQNGPPKALSRPHIWRHLWISPFATNTRPGYSSTIMQNFMLIGGTAANTYMSPRKQQNDLNLNILPTSISCIKSARYYYNNKLLLHCVQKKKQPFMFSYITLRKSNQSEWKFQK